MITIPFTFNTPDNFRHWRTNGAGADPLTYWDELDDRHAVHRRGAIGIAVGLALLLVGAVVVHSSLAMYALALSPLLGLEIFMFRRSRPTMRIPDYREPPTVEVELTNRPAS